MTLENFLIKNKACFEGLEYAKNMTLYEFYHNCNRSEWLIWLFSKTNPNDSKAIILAAAHCANACRDLLEDERSLKAIDAALNFELYSEVQLYEICRAAAYAYAADAAADAARAACAACAADAARYAAYAARAAAANLAEAAARDAWAAEAAACYAYRTAWNAADALGDKKLIADIVRKHLPLKLWNQDIINN